MAVAVSDLSPSTQDYLKCAWTLQEWSSGPVSVTALAERLGVRTSTASDGVKKLAAAGLVEHAHYGGVTLTDEGRAHALAMVRRHRLLETFLVQELGYDWDQVHDEAEVLEHAVSDRLVAAIDARLGHPTRDPHGDPIPSADGAAHLPDAVPLSQAGHGEATITRIADDDPARLRAFAQVGLVPDALVEVSEGEDGVAITLDGVETSVALDEADAEAIWVTPRT